MEASLPRYLFLMKRRGQQRNGTLFKASLSFVFLFLFLFLLKLLVQYIYLHGPLCTALTNNEQNRTGAKARRDSLACLLVFGYGDANLTWIWDTSSPVLADYLFHLFLFRNLKSEI